MKFEYFLDGIGWAAVSMEIEGKSYFGFPGYISEPLIDLCEGLLSIIPGCVPDDELKFESSFKLHNEPRVDKWKIRLLNNSKLEIVIECFKNHASKVGKIEFEGTCDLIEFLREVVKVLELILAKHGFVGYKDTWYSREFPLSSYLKLKHYIYSKQQFPTSTEKSEYGSEVYRSDIQDELRMLMEAIQGL